MKIVYMGTPEIAADILKAMLNAKINIALVVTQPDRPVGRKKIITPSSVKEVALKANIPIFQPENINLNYEAIAKIKPDLIVTCAYGQILSANILALPKIDAINIHASLLPKYRGAAPVQYAILNGETETGISIIKMVEKMDAGAIIYQKKIKINNEITSYELFQEISELAKESILKVIEKFAQNEVVYTEQNENDVSYAPTIKKDDEIINFKNNKIQIYNQIRALYKKPIAYFNYENKRMKIIQAKLTNKKSDNIQGTLSIEDEKLFLNTVDGQIELIKIQLEGKKVMLASDWIKGRK